MQENLEILSNGKQKNKQVRNSNIELLRCILMWIIVFYHLLVHGTLGIFFQFFDWQPLSITNGEIIAIVLCMFPVDCFVIISGYYGINIIKNGRIDYSRLLKTYVPILFYSVFYGTIVFFQGKIDAKEYLTNFFPVIQGNYWFATCYIVLCLISPVLNHIFDTFYKYKYFISGLLIIILLNYITHGTSFSKMMGGGSNGLFIFIICYFLGRYISKIDMQFLKRKKIVFLMLLCSYLIEFIFIFCAKIIFGKSYWSHISLNSSPFTIFQAICVFLLFRNIKEAKIKIINKISTASFAVYLITENLYVRKPMYTIVNGGGGRWDSFNSISFGNGFCHFCFV